MNNVVFLVLRRMRRPLLTLVLTYAVAVLGLTLIPGQDAEGNRWYMDFFHAFYFVSFMATTIGFGEIPYAFSDAQRLWVIFSLYATVIVWLYAIGTLLALIQDHTFRHSLTERRFSKRVRAIREPFVLVCGYGETGSVLVHALTARDQRVVVLDRERDRVSLLRLENLRQYVPALDGDAGRPAHLLEAGLGHPQCRAVVALTDNNEINLKIALTGKLLHPEVKVICRADSHDVEANMASFGTDYIIDPYDTFSNHLATAMQAPGLYLLHEWLTSLCHQPLIDPVYPPTEGVWLICGYGRFGKAVYRRLKAEGVEPVVIERRPEQTGVPEGHFVVGRGTEAVTLEEANVARAVGIVAGTDDDTNNLSIIMTARELNPDLFTVVRQNEQENQSIFQALGADMVMHPSTIVANKVRVLLATPLLYEFMSLALHESDAWACELVSRVGSLESDRVPAVWEVRVDAEQCPAMVEAIAAGKRVRLARMIADPRNRKRTLQAIPLLLRRGNERQMLPDLDSALKSGDSLLFCGRESARSAMAWIQRNAASLDYVTTGDTRPQGWVWRAFSRRPRRPRDGEV
ncbi:MAG: potassium transporter TrkA [Candidatus Sedimenticola endophacoides]|uniref:Potassium transporter TrkA n=1 Tax=Candidatus Sedimenticola endophacoides TaxID=2548426 RepID=A0A657PNK5_9GAMM|nr:MAG: potassium transporter TrkA [Candidatus Sedimenticola endophacoides]OQX37759.1 MAG: potassium transporter TrkA [Candidatus Sedimenticola endophacoides]OQX38994.1 MAG: potassium transporter TrkA [Candidatus Sedimenticola endophacoides]OQX43071.1 MAG: potassium transporter TrkA [Candidatus Sedimenticola endophacoides]OQX46132.1 MAG: potassium transporter TrkA [Candidatus Sedimenticola endophacoides]